MRDDSSGLPFEFDDVIGDSRDRGEAEDGRYTCPLCGAFSNDSVDSVKGHISRKTDAVHVGQLGWNHERAIGDTES